MSKSNLTRNILIATTVIGGLGALYYITTKESADEEQFENLSNYDKALLLKLKDKFKLKTDF